MTYDVVVVGAGSAGAPLAARLSENPDRSVLLLDAGPDYPTFDGLPDDLKYGHATGHLLVVSPEHDWDYTCRATADGRQIQVAQGRATGGSSAINGQLFIRGVPDDYDGWAEAGNPGWSYADLLPLFRRIENNRDFAGKYHGNDGPIPVHRYPRSEWKPVSAAFYEAAAAAGFATFDDANRPESNGVGPSPLNNGGGIRHSTALGYLAPARDRDNLEIRGRNPVTRIIVEDGRAVGVEVAIDGRTETIEARRVVVSAGAIGSPTLLLRSGIGPRGQLDSVGVEVLHDLPGVGEHLLDHPCVPIWWQVAEDYVARKGDPFGQVMLRFTAPGSPVHTDMFIRENQLDDRCMFWTGSYAESSTGTVRLVSADPAVRPAVDFNFLAEEFDRQRMRDAVRIGITLADHPALTRVFSKRLDPAPDFDLADDAALDGWIHANVDSGKHLSSTCRMGPATDPLAVVDAECRVHGVPNLHVADASIMPRVTRGNTNATAIVIGERVARFIDGRESASTTKES